MNMMSFKSFLLSEKDSSFLVAKSGKDSVSLDNRLVLDALNSSLAKVTSEPFLTPYMAFGSLGRILAHAGIILPQRVFFELESGETVFKVDHFGKAFGPDSTGTYGGPGDGDGYFIYFAYERNDSGFYTCYAEVVDPIDLADLLADDGVNEGLDETINSDGHDIKAGDHIHMGLAVKGGAGYRGKVTRVDTETGHVHAEMHGPHGKFGPRTFKGPSHLITKEGVNESSETVKDAHGRHLGHVYHGGKKWESQPHYGDPSTHDSREHAVHHVHQSAVNHQTRGGKIS